MTLLIGVGGIVGAIVRYSLGNWLTTKSGRSFPLATWIANTTGSFLLGLVAYLAIHNHITMWMWMLVGIGFLGSYTTFSTFGYETIQLIKHNEMKNAILYVTASVISGLFFAWVGSLAGSIIVGV